MSFKVVIPARYASSRLPGKPLVDVAGAPMVIQAWRRACDSGADEVVIATDDARVMDAAQAHGAPALMTSPDHPSGTDRLAEVVEARAWGDETVVVNVQGDEPLIPPAVIDQVARNLALDEGASMATLCEPIIERAVFEDPNAVKVVMDRSGLALYFSRAPVPWPRDAGNTGALPTVSFRHIGIYAYRAGLLRRFVTWPPAPLERIEMLEQLRVMHAGERIHVEQACEEVPGGVETLEDLERLRVHLDGL